VDRWPELVFRNWQNSHSLIGSFEDLNAATVDDVARFFRTHYAPNNAVLVIAGDIDPDEARRLVEQYFGEIPAQPRPEPPDLSEPERSEPLFESFPDRLAKVPAVAIGYPGPKRRSRDYNAMVMLDLILTGGESSRFHQNLVKGKQSVIQYEANLGWPFAGPADYRDPAPYAMYFLYNPAFNGRKILEQVEAEIGKVQAEGVPDEELQRARTYLRSSRIRQMQSSQSRAMLLGRYEVLDGDPEHINTELDDFLSVTAAEIRETARKYIDPRKRTVLDIVPANGAGASNGWT
jgi:predicted Zn-dependent peptidase